MTGRSLDLKKIFLISFIHIITIIGLLISDFSIWYLLTTPIVYLLLSLSFSLYFHRFLSHRSFEINKIFSYILLFLTSIRLSGNPVEWVSKHRFHHASSDKNEDPYETKEGFIESHLFWHMRNSTHGDDIRKKLLSSDVLLKYPYLVFFENLFIRCVPHIFLLVIVLFFWGFSSVIWNIYLPIILSWHGEWFVNSLCHKFGYATNKIKDNSKNLWILSFLFVGEGWHNNHHADPRRALHGTGFGEFDLTAYVIKRLEGLKLVSKVKWNMSEEAIIKITAVSEDSPVFLQTFCEFINELYENLKRIFETITSKIK